jgi:TfoX/Sxy family transcriptional regulator of competence genes
MEKINISKRILFGGLILLVSGFVLMAVGSDTYSFLKITLAPLFILAAYGLVAYSVIGKRQN